MNAHGIVNHNAIGIMAVAVVNADARISRKPRHSAFKIKIVCNQFVSARFLFCFADLQPVLFRIAKNRIAEGEVFVIRQKNARFRHAVGVEISARDKQRMVVRPFIFSTFEIERNFSVVFEHIYHGLNRGKSRRLVHLQRSPVCHPYGRVENVVALRHV